MGETMARFPGRGRGREKARRVPPTATKDGSTASRNPRHASGSTEDSGEARSVSASHAASQKKRRIATSRDSGRLSASRYPEPSYPITARDREADSYAERRRAKSRSALLTIVLVIAIAIAAIIATAAIVTALSDANAASNQQEDAAANQAAIVMTLADDVL